MRLMKLTIVEKKFSELSKKDNIYIEMVSSNWNTYTNILEATKMIFLPESLVEYRVIV